MAGFQWPETDFLPQRQQRVKHYKGPRNGDNGNKRTKCIGRFGACGWPVDGIGSNTCRG